MHTHIHTYTHTHTHTQEYLRKHVSKHKNHGNRQGKSGYYFVGASLPQSAGGVRLATMEIVARLGASDISTLSPDALAYVRTCKLSSTNYVEPRLLQDARIECASYSRCPWGTMGPIVSGRFHEESDAADARAHNTRGP